MNPDPEKLKPEAAPEVSQAAGDAANEIITGNFSTWSMRRQNGEIIQRAIDAAVAEERDKLTKELAESKAVAKEREQLSAERAARQFAELAREQTSTVLEQTERDRQEAVAALRRRDTAILAIEEDRNALRCNLAQAERGVLQRKLAAAEKERDEARETVRNTMWRDEAEGSRQATIDSLSARCAYLEKENDSLSSESRDARGVADKYEDRYFSTIAERDALAQRVAELVAARDKIYSAWGELKITECKTAAKCKALEKELQAVRVCFAEASQSAGPTTVHVETLKARCAKLEKALRYPRYGDTAHLLEHVAAFIDRQQPEGWSSIITPHLRRAARECAEALNQSPA